MAYIEGEGRNQGTLFPVVLDDMIPENHICRVVDAFVERRDKDKLGFERAQPADTRQTGLRSTLSAKAVSLWLSKSAPLFKTPGGRVPPQRGSDVVAGATVSRLQIHR